MAVLSPGRGKTKTGRLWVYVRDDRALASIAPAAWLRYSRDRKGEHPQAHLKNFKGVLQADAYAGFAKLYANGNFIEASCWVHARKPFWDLHESQGRVPGSVAEQHSGALVRLMRSKPTSVVAHWMSDAGCAKRDPGRCSRNCSPGRE